MSESKRDEIAKSRMRTTLFGKRTAGDVKRPPEPSRRCTGLSKRYRERAARLGAKIEALEANCRSRATLGKRRKAAEDGFAKVHK
jgi:hypothetical protein